MKKLIIFIFSVVLLGSCQKDIEGCTDVNAVNYNPDANIDNSTCQYVPTLSTAPVVYDEEVSASTGGIISSDGGSEVTLRGVCWSDSSNPTILNDTTIDGSGTGNFQSFITGLEFNTTYYLRAYATNSNGTGYGDEVVFSTASVALIPDQNFEQALIDFGLDILLDGKVKIENIDTVTILSNFGSTTSLYGRNISDLTGIESFISLKDLDVANNQLLNIDLSQNLQLEVLRCQENQISNLDVSNNNLLSYFDCSSNQISSLDVSNNNLLTDLSCGYNQISNLDVSNNIQLERLYISQNQISTLDVSDNNLLTTVWCDGNQLTSLDISGNPNCHTVVVGISSSGNPITCVNLKNGMTTSPNNLYASFYALNCPNLSCVEVDDVTWATATWFVGQYIDAGVTFSTNCNYPAGCF